MSFIKNLRFPTTEYIKKYKTEIIILLIVIWLLYKIYTSKYRYVNNYKNHDLKSDTLSNIPIITIGSKKLSNKPPKKTAKNKSEKECRRILESIYGKSFHSVRPDFLEYTNGHNLELDMYNEELKLACEYQGAQHYKFIKYFHKSYDDFINLTIRDKWKANKCKQLGIRLITIPYTVKFEDLSEYIKNQLNTLK